MNPECFPGVTYHQNNTNLEGLAHTKPAEMAEYAYLKAYREPCYNNCEENNGYQQHPNRRERSYSQQSTDLAAVPENGSNEVADTTKDTKRRFSLDVLFSRKKKSFSLQGKGKRNSTDSTASIESESQAPRRESTNSTTSRRPSLSKSEAIAYCFA